jgi:heparin binding hemagglutinin HbhA
MDMAKAKFDIKTEATRTLHAGVGVVDLAVETVKELATDAQKFATEAQKKAQKTFEDVQKDAQKRLAEVQKTVTELDLQPQALRTQATKEAAARRELVEKRVAALQSDAQKFVTSNVETATDTYEELAKRGETVVRKFRNKPATKATVANAETTKAKAKTTATQAKKSPAKKSAKATGTAAKKTVKSAPQPASCPEPTSSAPAGMCCGGARRPALWRAGCSPTL